MPSTTGIFLTLKQSEFDALAPDGNPLHFRLRGVTEIDPFTDVDTGKTARELITDLVAIHGWPLIGIFVSGSGQSTPHLAIHRSAFPTQTGNPEARAEKLQDALDAALENIYKNEQSITDPTDPDFGQTITLRNFFVNAKIFRYRNDGLYDPSPAVQDYLMRLSDVSPGAQWWLD